MALHRSGAKDYSAVEVTGKTLIADNYGMINAWNGDFIATNAYI
jgi:hypothetical protein